MEKMRFLKLRRELKIGGNGEPLRFQWGLSPFV
jgi:hypothetical protein